VILDDHKRGFVPISYDAMFVMHAQVRAHLCSC
jgi:hypothetical protein